MIARLFYHVTLAALPALCWFVGAACGAPVEPSLAGDAVKQWLAADPSPLAEKVGHSIKSIDTISDSHGGSIYHIIRLAPSGFVIVAADDRIEPMVAFSARGDFNHTVNDSLKALVEKDLPSRLAQAQAHPNDQRYMNAARKWRQFKEGTKPPPTGGNDLATNVSTVWVAPFLQSLWDQQTVGNNGAVACYNYYTPPYAQGSSSNYPCGCVATAMAQLLYYYQYPDAGVGTNSFNIGLNGAVTQTRLRGGDGAGGPYHWSDMPANPQNPTAAQCQAIGALTFDAGVAIDMDYEVDGSQATVLGARNALAGTFLYSNAIFAGQDNPWFSLSSSLVNMVNPNLDARLPVLFGIWAAPADGHCVVCDGYGYIGGTLYHHLNLGFSGDDNAWYALPDINTADYLTYTNISSCIYNVYPSGAGEIVSGRIVDNYGNPVPNASVTASRFGGGTYTATGDTNGIYALIGLPSTSQYALAVIQAGYSNATGNVSVGDSQNNSAITGNVWGANFVLSPTGAPAILVPPQSQTALVGETANFTVSAAGAGTLTYQWRLNGISLGQSGASLTISNLSAANAGTYSVVVGNAYGIATSAGAALNLEQPGGEQLALNGGFESGSFLDWTTSGNMVDTFVTTVATYVHDGAHGAELGPSGTLGFLTQNIITTAGASCVLSCWLNSPDGKTPNEFVVSWNGTNVFDQINMGRTGWTNLQFLVTANSASTPVEFGFRNDNSYFGLDSITINNLVPVTPPPQIIAQTSGGGITLTMTNLTGRGAVIVQSSSDLAQWTPIFTNTPGSSGFQFTDTLAANFQHRFYRAVGAGSN